MFPKSDMTTKGVNIENSYRPVEDKILAAANDTFIRYGFHGTTIEKIAIRAGVNKTSVHYYFRTKENMYALVFKNNLTLVFDFLNHQEFQRKNKARQNNYPSIEKQRNLTLTAWFIINEIRVNGRIVSEIISEDIEVNRLISSIFNVTYNLVMVEKLILNQFAEIVNQNLRYTISSAIGS